MAARPIDPVPRHRVPAQRRHLRRPAGPDRGPDRNPGRTPARESSRASDRAGHRGGRRLAHAAPRPIRAPRSPSGRPTPAPPVCCRAALRSTWSMCPRSSGGACLSTCGPTGPARGRSPHTAGGCCCSPLPGPPSDCRRCSTGRSGAAAPAGDGTRPADARRAGRPGEQVPAAALSRHRRRSDRPASGLRFHLARAPMGGRSRHPSPMAAGPRRTALGLCTRDPFGARVDGPDFDFSSRRSGC